MIDAGDLKVLADRLAGSQDNIQEHINAMGLTPDCATTLIDDLEAAGLIDRCLECEIWEYPRNMEDGLCLHCFEELEDELEDYGFDDDDLDDEDDILDEVFEDLLFDETDEDFDL